ncbi:flagellar export chaperone FliS [Priestia megaterium]|uniref:flagellar export chaperone FliS n=2 Tax=Priestia megaterium TaxID=1404 RepID=UPI000D50DBED|nr:flagellar export chaperone FliS [Priestia megaterium]MBU8854674.1 flagellar export chaperone FliS [Bacillus sp. FJAT-26377]PVC70034.1 flagellar export chaperone FliS [Priestia megaterium]
MKLNFITEELIYHKSPQELTAMMYEKFIQNIDDAVIAIQHSDYFIANEKIKQCNNILYRLGIGLTYQAGIIPEQLDILYNYMSERLIMANFKKDTFVLYEVQQMMNKLSNAWNEVLKTMPKVTSSLRKNKLSFYEQHISITLS